MTQNVEQIQDHARLFHQPEYQELFVRKREFENCHSTSEVDRVGEWTKGWDYREKNFAREALTINPAKACQPLGAIFAASGFEGTLPFVHGSQGCVAYFRTHLTRHFKEPFAAVSSSMTEDAAVFGGLKNMIEGLANAYALYKPKMIALCTTCMAEVIGDDLGAFITTSKNEGSVPQEFPVPYAHTPSFVGSHITGYDNMLKGILTELKGEKTTSNGKLNFIPGFDTYVTNNRELDRILNLMEIPHTIFADNSDSFDSPNEGEYVIYNGKTTLAETTDAINADATIALQTYSTEKNRAYLGSDWQQPTYVARPFGIRGTDAFLMKLSELTGKPIPRQLEIERGRAVDAMTDSQAWLHGKPFAIYGDPDLVISLLSFALEMGMEPVHIVVTNSTEEFEADAQALLDSYGNGKEATIWAKKTSGTSDRSCLPNPLTC